MRYTHRHTVPDMPTTSYTHTYTHRYPHTHKQIQYNNDMPTNADHTHMLRDTRHCEHTHSLIYAGGHPFTNTGTVAGTAICQHILA